MADRVPEGATEWISSEPRPPEKDPTLGIAVDVDRSATPPHRLVTIGDSLTHGFMSGAIFRTDISWPAVVAYEMGLDVRPEDASAGPAGPAGSAASGAAVARPRFRYPVYEPPNGPGGLPFDLERVARAFVARYGESLNWHEIPSAARWIRRLMAGIEQYWERGEGSIVPETDAPYHNLASYGWDVADAALLTVGTLQARIDANPPSNAIVRQLVQNDRSIAGRRVLASCDDGTGMRTVFDAARRMGEAGEGHGIETLVVLLGANNALGSVVALEPEWTPDDYLTWDDDELLRRKTAFNVWQPQHFDRDWARLVDQIRTVRARHVIVGTVPQVTIAPICRGVGGKVRRSSRYFEHYTRPWISPADFDPDVDPNFTANEARAIDSAVDRYNLTIIDSVRAARRDGLDWYVFDLGGALDSLASRRYVDDPAARPSWWTPYQLPPELASLDPVPDTRFYGANATGRTQGGLFSLDGVHPTTSAYGLVADEIIKVMLRAGVEFRDQQGVVRSSVGVDFARLLAADGLLSRPPACVDSSLALLSWLDDMVDWVQGVLPFG